LWAKERAWRVRHLRNRPLDEGRRDMRRWIHCKVDKCTDRECKYAGRDDSLPIRVVITVEELNEVSTVSECCSIVPPPPCTGCSGRNSFLMCCYFLSDCTPLLPYLVLPAEFGLTGGIRSYWRNSVLPYCCFFDRSNIARHVLFFVFCF
jgi:hypothetical protein